jgi:hypothetical protein
MAISFHHYRDASTAARMREQIARIGHVNGYPLWISSKELL